MPIHIEANEGDVAKVVLLPGDPERAGYIAENFLKDAKLYTGYRKMFGFTGMYKGKNISVQTTGMGSPSISIIVEELIMLGAKSLVRIGTCGTMRNDINISDLIIASGAHSTHDIFSQRFNGACFSATPDFLFTSKLYENAVKNKFSARVGAVITSETFYEESFDLYEKLTGYGGLGIEMEAYALFGLAARNGVKAATVLTVTDIIKEKLRGSKEQIKKGVDAMTTLVLDTIVENYDYLCE